MNTLETMSATRTERNHGTAGHALRAGTSRGPGLSRGQQQYADLLWRKAAELAGFCLREGAKAFVGWEAQLVFHYCFHHLAHRTVFVERANGGIVACAFAWGVGKACVLARDYLDQPIFQFEPSADNADGIFVAEVIALPGPGTTRKLRKVFKMAAARWPNWQSRAAFTYRIDGRGVRKLEQLRPAVLRRMVLGYRRPEVTILRYSVNR